MKNNDRRVIRYHAGYMIILTVQSIFMFNVACVLLSFLTFPFSEYVLNNYHDEIPIGTAAFVSGVSCFWYIVSKLKKKYEELGLKYLYLLFFAQFIVVLEIERRLLLNLEWGDVIVESVYFGQILAFIVLLVVNAIYPKINKK